MSIAFVLLCLCGILAVAILMATYEYTDDHRLCIMCKRVYLESEARIAKECPHCYNDLTVNISETKRNRK